MNLLTRQSRLLILLGWMTFTPRGFAQTTDTARTSEVEELRQMVRELSARVTALEQQQQRSAETSAAANACSAMNASAAAVTKEPAVVVSPEPAGRPALSSSATISRSHAPEETAVVSTRSGVDGPKSSSGSPLPQNSTFPAVLPGGATLNARLACSHLIRTR